MPHQHLINKYKSVQYSNISKTKQVVILYEGMEKFIKRSIEALTKTDLETHYNMMMKTSAIVTALHRCVDFNQGGEIAKILNNYYISLSAKILSIYKDNDITIVQELLKDVTTMRLAWDEIDKAQNNNNIQSVDKVILNSTSIDSIITN